MAARAPHLSRRAAAKAARRRALIDATIRCIAAKGLGGTTLADVAKQAGLSQGIVNLHFRTKDNLLKETLEFLAAEYDERFMQTLADTPDDPLAKLEALMAMDLSPALCERRKLAVWFAFWGEVKFVPTYQKICAERDRKYDGIVHDLVQQVIDEGGYRDVDARAVSDSLTSMTDGFWLSCLVDPKRFDRDAAQRAVDRFLRATFPASH